MIWPKTEADVARPVVAWLNEFGWEVYQEVTCGYGDSCADIVARRGSVLWVVEVKRSLSLAVMGQARRWERLSNMTSVAVPTGSARGAAGEAALDYLALRGIGMFVVTSSEAQSTRAPRLRRRRGDRLANVLCERHKTYSEAGAANGRRWTPFQRTCEAIRDVVAASPGIPLRDLIARVEHHYRAEKTARACISNLAQCGVITGIEARREGRELRFYSVGL